MLDNKCCGTCVNSEPGKLDILNKEPYVVCDRIRDTEIDADLSGSHYACINFFKIINPETFYCSEYDKK